MVKFLSETWENALLDKELQKSLSLLRIFNSPGVDYKVSLMAKKTAIYLFDNPKIETFTNYPLVIEDNNELRAIFISKKQLTNELKNKNYTEQHEVEKMVFHCINNTLNKVISNDNICKVDVISFEKWLASNDMNEISDKLNFLVTKMKKNKYTF